MLKTALPQGVHVQRRTVGEADLIELQGKECVVCYDKFEIGGSVAVLKCRHVFDFQCSSDWFMLVSSSAR